MFTFIFDEIPQRKRKKETQKNARKGESRKAEKEREKEIKRRKDREGKLVGRMKVLARVRDILSRCYPCFVWICRCTFASYRRVLHRQWTIRRCALQYAAALLLPIASNLVCIGFFKYRKILYGWTPDKRRFYTFRFSKYPRAAGKRNGNSHFGRD